jgi:uncharacterized membrane protein YqjE
MELAEPSETNSDNARDDSPTGEASVSSSLEHLVAGSQGVITKRIDLALLEGQELLSRTIERAALVGAGMVLAAVAWFAGAGAFVLLAVPDASPIMRLAAFGLLNGAGAVGLVTLAMRHGRSPTRVGPNGNGPTRQREPLPAEGKH